ncbi:MAG: hypothetical protein QMC95_02715 [Desulfitobacteriaceae bacterium]|nr:hypothetical protein [Desulfitobacteriaceae bacterium]MDI6913116.1 hypothetical protein [Desulfitobacteriaceae bacterium]
MHEPLKFWFRPYSLYPSINPNPNSNPNRNRNRNYNFKDNVLKPSYGYEKYSCKYEPSKPIAYCLGSPTILLLAPAGFGIAVALLLAFSPDKVEGCYQRPAHKGVAATVIYTAFVTLALALYVYYTLDNNDDDLLNSFLPLSIGLATLLGYYGTVYFFLVRLDPHSFSGDFGDDLLAQFLTFIYYSITTFATAQDGDIKPSTLGAKSLVSMEILTFIYVFTLGIVIFTSSKV